MVERPEASGEVVLVCEHASKLMPVRLGSLGLDAAALESHIAWDIGALAVARRLSDALDAPLVAQAYSRLAYDCNRPPESPAAIPEKSEIYIVPGNAGLTGPERQARVEALYDPFHAALEGLLDRRAALGQSTVLVTVHSFTPVYFGESRDGHLGVLHDTDASFADRVLSAAAESGLDLVRRNYPYSSADGVTHTLRRHAITRGLPNVMLEIRNDLIADEAGQEKWAVLVADLIRKAVDAGREGERLHA
ncbi:MAG: N-formylglutamate amidohydrolase [Rhizobiales bacterium]|nr:N-formylglutamate amidohydrolase [Hyphomicrobiales bacterium]MBA69594.1 N-formylglutamate amidohydrolase [Hyphomicrobiales bacterium]